MAGIDPISLAVIGAATGAIASPRDPLKGALIGGTLGFGGGSALAAGSAGAAGTAGAAGIGAQGYAAAVPGLTATGPGSQAAMLAAQTGEFGLGGLASTAAAGSAPGSLASGFWNAANRATIPGTVSPSRMAMQGLQMAQPQQQAPATGPNTFRGAKQINTTEPILSLLATAEPRRRQPMSLL